MPSKGQHVVPNNGQWSVRRSGSERASKVFGTQDEAIEYARRLAQNQQTELYIHGRDGRIRERNSYGGDRSQPRS